MTTYTLVLELVGPGWRTMAASALQLVWTGGKLEEDHQNSLANKLVVQKPSSCCLVTHTLFEGILLVAVVAKYVLHWRYTQLALHMPTLATLLYIW